MRQVSDAFLLNMAEVSATLIGLFLVGVFFYVETGLPRAGHARTVFEPYLRAGTRITLIVFAVPIGLSLALVAALGLIVLPWALGGLHPTRGDLAWAIVLAFVAGFLSIGATVMSAFDVARLEAGSQ